MNMNVLKLKSLIWLMAGVLVFSACKDDDTEDPTLAVSSITTTDGTDLYGATSATTVGTDQNILIGFSGTINGSTLGNVKLKNGDNTVASSVTASGSTVTIDPTEPLFGGTVYTVQINGVQSTDGATSGNVSTSFTTAGIGLGTAPQANAQTTYFQFNGNYVDVVGTASKVMSQNTWVEDRFGEANGALMLNGSTAPGNGDIVEFSGDFVHESMTLSTWFKVDAADFVNSILMFGVAVERGYFLEVGGDLAWLKFATSHSVSPDPANHYFGTAWTDPNGDGQMSDAVPFDYLGSIAELVGVPEWAQIVMSYDAATSIKSIYINGVLAMQVDLDVDPTSEFQLGSLAIADKADGTGDAIPGINDNLALGYFCSPNNTATGWADYTTAENTFIGAIDDFRIWNVALTQEQITALYGAEKP